MRLLTHNTLRNNSNDAKGEGFPLGITATEVRVDEPYIMDDDHGKEEQQRNISFVKGLLNMLDWSALVKAASEMGLNALPSKLTEDLVKDEDFLRALFHVLMNVHLVRGILTCPRTGREFLVLDGIPNMILKEDECENARM
eukprot:CAMPEP_0194133682 /NCGR_PEP_ID=MMETSP0152-20130528/3750_1 /TAXON_ID=1049557 /ORGANISM="Thalassiothrix antarctica, Strain L6-D1" /LENGTH=140 /DNA_ID=CAMNT_0038829027 /DNA_START=26 /DNA_END=448 /DNA_ORIENTATION=+